MKCLAYNIGPVTNSNSANVGKLQWVVVHPLFGNCLCVADKGADASGFAAQIAAYVNSGIVVDVPTPGEATAVATVGDTGKVFQNAANAGPLPTNLANVPLI